MAVRGTRLRDYVRRAMAERQMKKLDDLASASGVPVRTINNVLTGRPSTSRSAVELALGWMPGSIQAVIDGGEPIAARAAKAQELPASEGVRVVAAGIGTLSDPDDIRATIAIAHQRLAEIEGMADNGSH